MDDRRFDNLTRSLASGQSRRTILKGFLSIGGAAVASTVISEPISARRSSGSRRTQPTTTTGSPCPPETHACNTNSTGCCANCGSKFVCGYDCCDSPAQCCDGECCATGSTCVGEETCCPDSQLCDGAPGGCCGFDQQCCDGACIDQNACCEMRDCSAGQICCSDFGFCGIADFDGTQTCASNEDCCSGICQSGTCVPTIAGICTPESSICFGNLDTQCGLNCNCASAVTGGSVCGTFSTCQQNCDSCAEGTVCVEAFGCCGSASPFLCASPCPPAGGDCFTAATRISMADGSSRPISELQLGDALLGADGIINTVSAIRSLRLGNRSLYSFNDSDYFVTESHPFMTDSGWKSINPALTKQTIRDLDVDTLKIGDRIHKLAGILEAAGVDSSPGSGALELDMSSESIQQINSISTDPETLIYTISLTGNQTYFANGLLVHNKP